MTQKSSTSNFSNQKIINWIRLKNRDTDPTVCLHGNYYDKTPPKEWGIEAHLDKEKFKFFLLENLKYTKWQCFANFEKGLITMLMQDMVGGLEVEYQGKWYPVKRRNKIKSNIFVWTSKNDGHNVNSR